MKSHENLTMNRTALALQDLVLKTVLLTIAYSASCYFSRRSNTDASFLVESEFDVSGVAAQETARPTKKTTKIVPMKFSRMPSVPMPTFLTKKSW